MRDSRNILRGKCSSPKCDCPDYWYEPTSGNACDYCGCLPVKHENLTKTQVVEVEGNNEVVPLIVNIDEPYFKDEYVILLHQIEEDFKFLRIAQYHFYKIYPKWRGERLDKIDKLEKFANDLDNLKYKCDVTKVAASSIAVGTDLALVIATLCVFFGSPLAIPFIPLAIAGVASGVVNGGTAAYECVKKNKTCEAIKELFDEDKKDSKKIIKFIECSKRCHKTIEKLMNFEIFKELWKVFCQVNKYNIPSSKMDEFYKKFSLYINNESQIPELKKFLEICPNLLTLLPNTLGVQRENPNALKAIDYLLPIVLHSHRYIDSVFDLASLVSHGTRVAAPAAGKIVASVATEAGPKLTQSGLQSVLGGVCLLFDLNSLKVAVTDFKNGSESHIAKDIRTLTGYMKEDIKTLNPVFTYVAKDKLEYSVFNELSCGELKFLSIN